MVKHTKQSIPHTTKKVKLTPAPIQPAKQGITKNEWDALHDHLSLKTRLTNIPLVRTFVDPAKDMYNAMDECLRAAYLAGDPLVVTNNFKPESLKTTPEHLMKILREQGVVIGSVEQLNNILAVSIAILRKGSWSTTQDGYTVDPLFWLGNGEVKVRLSSPIPDASRP